MEQENDGIARWYVVHTYSGYENKVSQNLETIVENRRLQDLICEIRVPVEIVPDIKDGKEREIERKLFPGYVLVKMVMTDESWYIIKNVRGVTGFVGSGTKPTPLTAEEVEGLGVDKHEVVVAYDVGDSVTDDAFGGRQCAGFCTLGKDDALPVGNRVAFEFLKQRFHCLY